MIKYDILKYDGATNYSSIRCFWYGVPLLTFWEDLGLESLPKNQIFQIIKCLLIKN